MCESGSAEYERLTAVYVGSESIAIIDRSWRDSESRSMVRSDEGMGA